MNIAGGTIVWDLDVDDKKFTAKLSSASKGAKEFSNNLDRETKGASKALDGAGNSADVVSNKLTKLAKIAGGLFVLDRFVDFGKKILNTAAQFETLEVALTTVTGSSIDAARAMEKIQKVAKESPFFETSTLAEFTQIMAATGKTIDEAIDSAIQFGDVAAAFGKGNQEMGRMGNTLSQVIGKGKADVVDFKELVNAGWTSVRKDVAETMGVSMAQFEDMVSGGLIGYDQIYKASEKFTGSAEKQSNTFNALTQRLTESIFTTLSNIAKETGVFDVIKNGLLTVINIIDSIDTEKIINIINTMKEWADIIISILAPAFEILKTIFTTIFDVISLFVDWFQNTAWPVISQVFGFIKNIAIDLANYFQIVFGPIIQDAIGKIQEKFVAWQTKLIEIKGEIIAAYDAFSGWFKDTFGKSIAETIRDVLIWWGNEWSTKWVGNIKTIIDTIGFLIDKFSSLISKLGEVKQTLKDAGPLGEALLKTGGQIFGSFNPLLGRMFADGVSNFTGGLALVGEQGPELVNLPRGSDVYPTKQTAEMLSGSGATINIQEMIVRDDYDVDRFSEQIGFLVGIEPAIFEG